MRMTKTSLRLNVPLLWILGTLPVAQAQPNYRFDGKISREVLENYLSRSITMTELYRSPGDHQGDDIRMLLTIRAKFAGRSIYLWGGEARIADPKFLGLIWVAAWLFWFRQWWSSSIRPVVFAIILESQF